jgi:hypothetical protein
VSKVKLRAETRNALFEAGWRLQSAYQPPWLFPRDGRKLDRCAIASDPWLVTLHNGASILTATRLVTGQGATVDEAVLAALQCTGTDLRDAMCRLETALDDLIGVIRDAV